MRLLSKLDTYKEFKDDPEFHKLIKQKLEPQALEVKYTGTASASLTEIGSAMTAEFNGGSKEKSTILVNTTRANTPGSSYITFEVAGTVYYAYMTKKEVVTIACKTAANTTTGTYFTIYDSEASPTGYYVWLDKNGDGVTDKPTVATLTEIVCDISAATTADDVGVIVAAAIDAKGGFGAANSSGVVTVTMATKGDPTEIADVDTTYTIAVTEDGGADPGISGTGAECDITASTTAGDVATVIQGVIDGVSGITATVSTATITMKNDADGNVASVTVSSAVAYTLTQVKAGSDAYEGTPIYFKSASASDKNAAAGHVRKITAIGFYKDNGIPRLKSEEISLDVTAGTTRVNSSESLWFRIIHHGASDWGSGDNDAAGNISMQNHDAVVSYLVLAAGTNESEGAVIWVPAGWHVLIPFVSVTLDDIAVATAIDGAMAQMAFTGFDDSKNQRLTNLTPDNDTKSFPVNLHRPNLVKEWKDILPLPRHGTNVAKITINESKVNTATVIEFHAIFMLWYEAN